MPSYNKTPFAAPPKLLIEGRAEYLFGSFNRNVSPTKFQILSCAIAANVATITGYLIEGNLPAVGALISIAGTAVNGGVFNVANLALTAVTLDVNGVGSLSFALVSANFAVAADGGVAIIPQMEQAEVLALGASVPCSPYFSMPDSDAARTYQAVCTFPTVPTSCTVQLQAAAINSDGEYQSLGTVATVAAGVVTQNQAQFELTTAAHFRLNVSALVGAGTIVGKVLA
jgi:hypothetical protein